MHDEIKDPQRRFIGCVGVLMNVCGNQSFAQGCFLILFDQFRHNMSHQRAVKLHRKLNEKLDINTDLD